LVTSIEAASLRLRHAQPARHEVARPAGASALLGTTQFLVGALTAPLVGIAGKQSAVPMAVLIGLFGVGGLAVLAVARTRLAPADQPSGGLRGASGAP
jgi:hypothetical protein